MQNRDCLFCKIIRGEVPSYKLWEDDYSMAILDVFPNTRGQTLVLSKAHLSSYAFDLGNEDYQQALQAAKTVGKLLEQKLNVKRVAMVVEGMGIDHLHVKLYPLHGLSATFTETWTEDTIFFENYQGFISTLMGPKAKEKDLAAIQKIILT